MITHSDAQEILQRAFVAVGMIPSPDVSRFAGAVAFLESRYGQGWSGAGRGSHNWGAIQAGNKWTGARFTYSDTHPNPDGTSTSYRVDFRAYPTNDDGAADLLRVVYLARPSVLEAATSGSSYGVSRALYQTRYYEGFGPTPEARIENHHRALQSAYLAIVRVTDSESRPTIRRGSGYLHVEERDYVREWQRFRRLPADGLFGPVTEDSTRRIQAIEEVKVDGIVGPVTWGLMKRPNPVIG